MAFHRELPEADGKYLYINVVTRRARDLNRGSKSTIGIAEGKMDTLEIAKQELEASTLVIRQRNEFTGEIETFE